MILYEKRKFSGRVKSSAGEKMKFKNRRAFLTRRPKNYFSLIVDL
ncbi:hypothetical protein LEP1GSC060_2174 [Leptospira weilii serovar Ranarum str. ICFT]|uniref:Uncharacterized protein n=1 Tax=Leptospira weilii serovar Ranarum str. ICFT TaxID=1218598 RepID=N1WLD9_9LEPT|nr:hypothetical protein LEP1GSC060_2174 [Leptospira weilii serovar Ranarum str. ICFT]